MKLVGLYYHSPIPHLEKNHKSFADANGFAYQKYAIRNYYEKYRIIYSLLQDFPGELFIFIDSNSYFIHQQFCFPNPEHILINSPPGYNPLPSTEYVEAMHNFFILRSTRESLRMLEKVIADVSYTYLGERKIDAKLYFPKSFHNKCLLQSGDIYLNVDIPSHPDFFNFKNILVGHFKPGNLGLFSYANLLCGPAPELPDIPQADFEVINPGKPNALVTLYTPEIAMQGAVCERNLSRYCKSKELTLYVYRKNHRAAENISATWLKPELLLRHIADHDYIAWVDSDILISSEYNLDTSREFTAYQDMGNWRFNAGFMIFRNSEKIQNFLASVAARCESISDRSTTYENKGDQWQFILEAEKQFPDFSPLSNSRVNALPGCELNAFSPLLVHFVCMPTHVRTRVMHHYDHLFFAPPCNSTNMPPAS